MNEVFYTICVAALTAALFTALIPSEKYASQIKLLIACYAAAVIFSCVGNFGFDTFLGDILNTDTGYNDYSVTFREMTAKETAAALRTRIKEALAADGITAEKIYIGVNISDSGSISINEIRLVSINGSSETALNVLRRCVGCDTKLYIE